jgi:hypothetical protein
MVGTVPAVAQAQAQGPVPTQAIMQIIQGNPKTDFLE